MKNLLILLVLSLIFTSEVQAAQIADPFTHPHETTVNVCLKGDFDGHRDASERAVSEWSNNTVFDLVYDCEDPFIIVRPAHYGYSGWWGSAEWTGPCWTAEDSVHCDGPHYARLNKTYLDGERGAAWRYVTCHELGHLLGMEHGQGDCMEPGAEPLGHYRISPETEDNLDARMEVSHA